MENKEPILYSDAGGVIRPMRPADDGGRELAPLLEERDREPLTLSIDRIELSVSVGQWRGRKKVGEVQSQQPLLLFAKDDEAPLPWGRALEELLQEILQRVRAGS